MRSLQQQLLLEAGDFLERHPEKWTPFVTAMNDKRQQVLPQDPQATKFCALGVVFKLCHERNIPTRIIRDHLRENERHIALVNDKGGRIAVIKLLRRLARKA